MLKRLAVIGSVMAVAASVSSSDVSAQSFPGVSSGLSGATIQSLMSYLGYAPNDFCGFYYFVVTGSKGQFSPSLIQALLPMCGHLPIPPSGGNQGDNSDDDGSGGTGGGSVMPGGSGSGGSGSGGSSSGGSSSGGSSSGGSSGGASSGGTTSGGSSSGGTASGGPDGNPFGGGGNMVTPEPISLILLGTGLAGIGGVRARRRRPDSER